MIFGKPYSHATREIERLCAKPPKRWFAWRWVHLKDGRKFWLGFIWYRFDRNLYDGHVMVRYAINKNDLT